jgi:hypothetical protein
MKSSSTLPFFEMAAQTIIWINFGTFSQQIFLVKFPLTKHNKSGRSVGFVSLSAKIVTRLKI